MRVVAVVLLLVLAGCGRAAGDGTNPAAGSTKTAAAEGAGSDPALPSGRPAPEALSRFRCAKNAKDVWGASGYLANDGKTKATFQVTVLVGEPGGGSGEARTEQVADVPSNGSVKFDIAKIPAPEKDGTCRVQVLATS